MIEFRLPDMTCGHCASIVAKALTQADPGCEIAVDLQTRSVRVHSREDRQTLRDALFEAGYASV